MPDDFGPRFPHQSGDVGPQYRDVGPRERPTPPSRRRLLRPWLLGPGLMIVFIYVVVLPYQTGKSTPSFMIFLIFLFLGGLAVLGLLIAVLRRGYKSGNRR